MNSITLKQIESFDGDDYFLCLTFMYKIHEHIPINHII
jgi:hypothetical protein